MSVHIVSSCLAIFLLVLNAFYSWKPEICPSSVNADLLVLSVFFKGVKTKAKEGSVKPLTSSSAGGANAVSPESLVATANAFPVF